MKIFQFAVPIFIYFYYFTFILVAWRKWGHVGGVFLECLNERRLSFIQNNLFLETSTHRNYFLSRKYTKYYCFWLLQSCKTTPLNHSYKLCEDNLKKITTATVYYHVASLRLIYTCIHAWGGEGVRVELSMYKMYRKFVDWNKCQI